MPTDASTSFRLDRALSMHLVHPALQLLSTEVTARIPILMYHDIQDGYTHNVPYFETRTSPAVFAGHMRFLAENGYTTVHLDEALQAISAGKDTSKWVVLTFDDGFRSFREQALPVLQQYGSKATVFIVPEFTSEQPSSGGRPEYMTWQEVREIHSSGMQIGSHSMTHPELYFMNRAEIDEELRRSKSTLEEKLGVAIDSFAYPYALPEQDSDFLRQFKELLQANGYRVGVSTKIGRAQSDDDPFFLPRLPANSHDDAGFLSVKLNGGYDWLHTVQYLRKCMKGRRSQLVCALWYHLIDACTLVPVY